MRNEHANIIIFKDILKSVEDGEPLNGPTYEDAAKNLRTRIAGYIFRNQDNEVSDLVTEILRSDTQLTRDLIGFSVQAVHDPADEKG